MTATLPQGIPAVDARRFGVRADGSTDDTAALAAAIASVSSAGKVVLPPGTIVVSTIDCTNKQIILEGQGANVTIVQGKTGSSGPILDWTPSSAKKWAGIHDLTVDMSNVPSATAISLDNHNQATVEDIRVTGGAVGLAVAGTGASYFSRIMLHDQTTAAVSINGDGCGELYWDGIDIRAEAAVTLADGFLISRTTPTDVGGYYLQGVRVTKTSGTVTNAFRFTCNHASAAAIPMFMDQCVADSIGTVALYLDNVQNIRLQNSWLASGASSTGVKINKGQDMQFVGNWIDASGTGNCFDFTNAPINLVFVANRFGLGTAFNIPASSPPTGLLMDANMFGEATVTNDFTRLQTAQQSVKVHRSPFTVLGKITVTDSGPTISAGSGSPESSVTAPVGSVYLRSDGGASTTLYAKESGTGNTGWKAVQTA